MKFILACLVSLSVHASESQAIIDSMTPFGDIQTTDRQRIATNIQIRRLESDVRFLHLDSLTERTGREPHVHSPMCKDVTLEIDFRPEKFMRLLAYLREQFVRDFHADRAPDRERLDLTYDVDHWGMYEREFLRTIYGQLYLSVDHHILTYLFSLYDDVFMPSGSEMSEASRRGQLLVRKYVEIARRHVHDLTEETYRLLQAPDNAKIPSIKARVGQWTFHLRTMTYHIQRGITFAYNRRKKNLETILAQLGKGLGASLRRAELEFKFRRDGEAFVKDKLAGIDLNDESDEDAVFDTRFLYSGAERVFPNLESTFRFHRDVFNLAVCPNRGCVNRSERLDANSTTKSFTSWSANPKGLGPAFGIVRGKTMANLF